ncbi:MAG TPA: hypothetical protein VK657_01220, partial [Terriglobales bacterium]|nr:hypothetical protein [Terriglobales bacterium]
MSTRNSSFARRKEWLRVYGAALLTYLLATLFTQARFTGDAPDYVQSIVAYDRGQYYEFWEFGHLLWRPLGWLLFKVTEPLLLRLSGGDLEAAAATMLVTISWVAGLISVLALAAILRRLVTKEWVTQVTVPAFVCSYGFLNFAQTGTPYITSLAFMLLALWILVRRVPGDLSLTAAIAAGVLMGLMICCWLPFIVVVPAIVLAPTLLSRNISSLRNSLIAGMVAAVLVGALYLAVAGGPVGVRNVAGFRAWMQQTTGKTVQDKGLARTMLGFPRSFIYMGNDGMLFKRYLVHDPFNPVTTFDLLRLSLWKIILFYLGLAALVLNLFAARTARRLLALLVLTAVTVVGVAIYWQGGDIERYLPFYPILFMAIAGALANQQSKRLLNYVVLLFFLLAALVNFYAMSPPVVAAQQAKAADRIAALMPQLTPNSHLFVVNFQDEVYSFTRDFPFHPLNRAHTLKVTSLIEVGGRDAQRWPQDFATHAESVWKEGGDVWMTRRVLSATP